MQHGRFDGPVAQLVEHMTFNHSVAGSIPSRLTSYGVAVVCSL